MAKETEGYKKTHTAQKLAALQWRDSVRVLCQLSLRNITTIYFGKASLVRRYSSHSAVG